MIRPNSPRIAAKISMVRILTNLALLVRRCQFSSVCMYSQCWVGSICQGCATSVDAYADTADQVTHANGESSPEQGVSGEDVGRRVYLLNAIDLV
jgi:hypothetical protein